MKGGKNACSDSHDMMQDLLKISSEYPNLKKRQTTTFKIKHLVKMIIFGNC